MTIAKSKRMLTVNEVAEDLGLKPATVRDWLLKRKISYVKVGSRAVRIEKIVVEKIISAGTVPAREVRK